MTASRPLNRAYLSLGSNIDPQGNLPAAVGELARHGRVAAVSRVWETIPEGCSAQANILNAAVLLETPLSAERLKFTVIREIEGRLHRQRDPNNKNRPRTIDLDLILFNDAIFRLGERTIPDPDLLQHAYVAIPMAELDPDFVHPETGRSLAEIARTFSQAKTTMKHRRDVTLFG